MLLYICEKKIVNCSTVALSILFGNPFNLDIPEDSPLFLRYLISGSTYCSVAVSQVWNIISTV